MSAKKVKKAIRQQRRERRRAEREQARLQRLSAEEAAAERSAADEPAAEEKPAPRDAAEAAPATRRSRAAQRDSEQRDPERRDAKQQGSEQRSPEQRSPAQQSSAPRRAGAAVRVGAVVVTAGLVAVGAGSALADLSGQGRAPLAPLAGTGVASPQTGQTYLCPAMPGQAASLSTDGILEYSSRDGSAGSVFQALVLAAEGEQLPEAEAAQLSEQERLNSLPLSGQEGVIHHQETDQERSPLLEVSAAADGSPLTAGALYEYHADQGPVTGLAVGECAAAAQSSWFFGPETGPGATSLLTLSNPYDRASTVEVTTYDAEGERGASGARSIVVPPQTVRSVNMAALSGGSARLGVEVSSSGAPVTAQMQSSRAAGLTGTGVEFLPAAEAPAQEHHIPAVPMPDTTEAEGGTEGLMPAELWLHVPGEEGATVELQVYGEDGQLALDTPSVFTVEGGEVDVLELLGPEAGVYDVTVRTDSPSYVGVASRGMGETAQLGAEDEAAAEEAAQEEGEELDEDTLALDFSWGVGAQPLAPDSGALLPEIGRTEQAQTDLHLFSPAGGTVTYRLVGAGGELSEPQETEVTAGRTAMISAGELSEVMEDAVAVLAESPEGEAVYAALLTTDEEGRFSITRLSPLQDTEATVPVRIRD